MDFVMRIERIKYLIRKVLTTMLQWETQDGKALLQDTKTYLEVCMKELDNQYWQLMFYHYGPFVYLTKVFKEVEDLYEKNRDTLLRKLYLGEATKENAQFGKIRELLNATEQHDKTEILEIASLSFSPADPHSGGNVASVTAQSDFTSEENKDKNESTPHVIFSNWEEFKQQFKIEDKKDTEDEDKKEISNDDAEREENSNEHATIDNLESVENDVVGDEETYTQKDEQLDVGALKNVSVKGGDEDMKNECVLKNVDAEDGEAETKNKQTTTIAEEESPVKSTDILIIKEDNISANATAADREYRRKLRRCQEIADRVNHRYISLAAKVMDVKEGRQISIRKEGR